MLSANQWTGFYMILASVMKGLSMSGFSVKTRRYRVNDKNYVKVFCLKTKVKNHIISLNHLRNQVVPRNPSIACLKSTTETLEKGVKHVQS